MKLKNLIKDCDEKLGDIEISGLTFDSRTVTNGSLFFCIAGLNVDGHKFIADAAAMGAAAIVTQRRIDTDVPQITVENVRKCMAETASQFYGNPASKMKMAGITGTNGKTTTTYILRSILSKAGENVGIIGTNAIIYSGKEYPASMTTPDSIELNKILRAMADSGVTAVVMEVSAHALALDKIDGIIFDVAGFTNFSQDHLDFFGSMEKYGEAKRKFFSGGYARVAAVNVDDEMGRQIIADAKMPIVSYGCENPADVFAIDLEMESGGIRYVMNLEDDLSDIVLSMPGRFNMYNSLCAAAVAKILGVSIKDIALGIRNLERVEGRFNIIKTKSATVIIDFAHTDDGLKNILTAIREFAKKKIITVFGCGGNRDRTKRPIMGAVVSELSDFCIVTSDNPRFENPEEIIEQICRGVTDKGRNNFIKVTDRKEAIECALKSAKADDIILIAGKGAEKYMEVNGKKYQYCDEDFVKKLIEEYDL